MLKRILMGLVALAAVVLAYLLMWPVSIDPVPWNPPKALPLAGTYSVNERLATAELLMEGVGIGPEDVAVDQDGRIYGGESDGRILRARADGSNPEVFAQTGGRLLGLDFDPDGNLIAADAVKGLLSVSRKGQVTVLATEEGGISFGFTNNVAVANDGTVYFTDTSSKYGMQEAMADLLEHRPHGRLLAYDPTRKSTRRVLRELYFANGVAVSPDQSFVLVAETGTDRVKRHWLRGAQEGQTEIFIDNNRPCYPDGIFSDEKDVFWLALFAPRNEFLDTTMPFPFLRKILMRVPAALQAGLARYGFVLGLNDKGKVVHNLQDPTGPTHR